MAINCALEETPYWSPGHLSLVLLTGIHAVISAASQRVECLPPGHTVKNWSEEVSLPPLFCLLRLFSFFCFTRWHLASQPLTYSRIRGRGGPGLGLGGGGGLLFGHPSQPSLCPWWAVWEELPCQHISKVKPSPERY